MVSLSMPAASSSRARTTRIGCRGIAYPPGPYICLSALRRSSSEERLGRRMSRQRRMRPWQKKMVAKRMMRMSRTVNSLLLMFLVRDRARSACDG